MTRDARYCCSALGVGGGFGSDDSSNGTAVLIVAAGTRVPARSSLESLDSVAILSPSLLVVSQLRKETRRRPSTGFMLRGDCGDGGSDAMVGTSVGIGLKVSLLVLVSMGLL